MQKVRELSGLVFIPETQQYIGYCMTFSDIQSHFLGKLFFRAFGSNEIRVDIRCDIFANVCVGPFSYEYKFVQCPKSRRFSFHSFQ